MGEIVPIRDKFGAYLIGRDVGKRIRERYFAGDVSTWPEALDLQGVEQITESCADELLGTLARRAGSSTVRAIVFKNSTPAVREAIEYVLTLTEKPPPAPTPEGIKRVLERRKRSAARK